MNLPSEPSAVNAADEELGTTKADGPSHGEASASQAEGRRFEPGFPLQSPQQVVSSQKNDSPSAEGGESSDGDSGDGEPPSGDGDDPPLVRDVYGCVVGCAPCADERELRRQPCEPHREWWAAIIASEKRTWLAAARELAEAYCQELYEETSARAVGLSETSRAHRATAARLSELGDEFLRRARRFDAVEEAEEDSHAG